MEGKKNVIHIEFWTTDDGVDGALECALDGKAKDVVMVLADMLPRILRSEKACKALGMVLLTGDPQRILGYDTTVIDAGAIKNAMEARNDGGA